MSSVFLLQQQQLPLSIMNFMVCGALPPPPPLPSNSHLFRIKTSTSPLSPHFPHHHSSSLLHFGTSYLTFPSSPSSHSCSNKSTFSLLFPSPGSTTTTTTIITSLSSSSMSYSTNNGYGNRRPPTTSVSSSSSSSPSTSGYSYDFGQSTTDSESEEDAEEDADSHVSIPQYHRRHFDDDLASDPYPYDFTPPPPLPDRWDVLGLGQAMRLGLEKGTRKVVNHEERGRVLQAMDGCSYKAAAGGSLSNTLVALARLGCQPIGGPSLNVTMAGSIGSDPLGGFYSQN